MKSLTDSHQRRFATTNGVKAIFWLLLSTMAACGGGSEPGGSGTDDAADVVDATGDGGLLPDGAVDPDAGPNPDSDTRDADGRDGDDPGDAPDGGVPDDADGQGGRDVDTGSDPDGGDPSDADGASDSDPVDGDADAGDVRVFVPGTLPLPDYIQCDENSDCPNGSGNCLTVLTLNREDSSGRLRIPMNEVMPELERTGVCSLDCAVGEAACSTLALTVDTTPWNCQVMYVDESPYPTDDSGARPPFPFDDQLDLGEMAAGSAFGAMCRPPFERSEFYAPDFCVECSTALNCHPGSACALVAPWAAEATGAGVCLSPCAVDGGCPAGFECRQPDAARDGLIAGDETQEYCFPTPGSCTACSDADGDGFGAGGCAATGGATAVDCDDLDPLAWWEGPTSVHPFPEVCGPDEDANCNGIADRSEQVGTVAFGAAHCSECGDVCDRSAPQASTFECVRLTTGLEGTCRPVCDEPTRFFDCDGLPDNGCEAEVTDVALLFVPDCDGDGVGRANAPPQFDCAGTGSLTIFTDVDGDDATDDRRECQVVRAVDTEGSGFGADCNDGDDAINPLSVEVCDGIDNDCDGAIDPYALFQLGDSCAPSDAGVVGACRSGATRACDGGGEVTCQPAAPSVELCDGIDNDCDGLIDNLGAATPENRLGEACRASDDAGPCGAGALVCQGGGLVCSPVLLPEGDVPGDGNDADCDGVDADTERAIFVAVGGATVGGSGPRLGSPENPVGTLDRAYELIRARQFGPTPVTQVILASGDYALSHNIALHGGSFTLMGGWSWNPATNVWTPPTTGRSNIDILDVCPCDPPVDSTGVCVRSTCDPQNGFLAAVDVINPDDVRFSNVNLRVQAQDAALGPVVGVACWRIASSGGGPVASCASLSLDEVSIEMENARAGAPHPAPMPAQAGQQSAGQGPPICGTGPGGEFPCGRPGFSGGASACGANGGTGVGLGTDNGAGCFIGSTLIVYAPGTPGSSGLPSDLGGAPGDVMTFNGSCTASFPVGPPPGARGRTRVERGAGGGPGTGAVAAPPLSPSVAVAGGSGLPGGGGGGGGAAGDFGWSGAERFGGGGSSGGCGGNGGGAGRNGGTIIGLLIDDPSAAPVLTDVEVNVGSGGAGGAGQAGGAGGTGIGPVNQGAFTLGGASGHGAGGGGGGGGAGGSAIGIARWPAVRVVLTPAVGTAGSGGAGGGAGSGGTGGILLTLDAGSIVFETAAAGLPGTPGADGISARFCSLADGAPPAGEVRCR